MPMMYAMMILLNTLVCGACFYGGQMSIRGVIRNEGSEAALTRKTPWSDRFILFLAGLLCNVFLFGLSYLAISSDIGGKARWIEGDSFRKGGYRVTYRSADGMYALIAPIDGGEATYYRLGPDDRLPDCFRKSSSGKRLVPLPCHSGPP